MSLFNECLEFNNIIYDFDRYGVDEAIAFIRSMREMSFNDVCNQIMLGIKNKYHIQGLIELAKAIGGRFVTDASVVKDNYWAKVLVEKGIPIGAFRGYIRYDIMSVSTMERVTFGPLFDIKKNNLRSFIFSCRGNFSKQPVFCRKYPMKYIAWAALFQAEEIFDYLLNINGIDNRTVKMAIKGGSQHILDKITQKMNMSDFMHKLIKHHRNATIENVINQYPYLLRCSNNYRNTAERYRNFAALLIFDQ